MRIKIVLLLATFFGVLFTVDLALAGSMKCGVHLITDGGRYPPGKYEILKKCGEPTFKQGSIWIYDSPSKLPKEFHFDDSGLLVRIN